MSSNTNREQTSGIEIGRSKVEQLGLCVLPAYINLTTLI